MSIKPEGYSSIILTEIGGENTFCGIKIGNLGLLWGEKFSGGLSFGRNILAGLVLG